MLVFRFINKFTNSNSLCQGLGWLDQSSLSSSATLTD